MKYSQKEKRKLFRDFVKDVPILIVDKSSASRKRLAKTLVDLGAKMSLIQMCSSFHQGEEIIEQKGPRLILSDYFLRGGSGFDLFRSYRADKESKNLLNQDNEEQKDVLVLITANLSQAAVARAAEEDVDAFILKPYTLQSLEENLINATILKLHPSKYTQTIEEGKKALFAGDADKADRIFDQALELEARPSLAYYYKGQVEHFRDKKTKAMECFKDGLSFNHIHYKCQVGLFDLLMKDERYEDAYAIVKNLARYFPANPERLASVIRLAVITKSYEEISEYYEIFTDSEERTEELTRYIAAGLFVCGKHYLIEEKSADAINAFRKIVVSCPGEVGFILPIIETLYQYQMESEIGFFLSRYSPDDRQQNDFKVGEFLLQLPKLPSEQIIQKGLDLIASGVKNFHVHRAIIGALFKSHYLEKLPHYLEEAKSYWPEKDWGYWTEKYKKLVPAA